MLINEGILTRLAAELSHPSRCPSQGLVCKTPVYPVFFSRPVRRIFQKNADIGWITKTHKHPVLRNYKSDSALVLHVLVKAKHFNVLTAVSVSLFIRCLFDRFRGAQKKPMQATWKPTRHGEIFPLLHRVCSYNGAAPQCWIESKIYSRFFFCHIKNKQFFFLLSLFFLVTADSWIVRINRVWAQ